MTFCIVFLALFLTYLVHIFGIRLATVCCSQPLSKNQSRLLNYSVAIVLHLFLAIGATYYYTDMYYLNLTVPEKVELMYWHLYGMAEESYYSVMHPIASMNQGLNVSEQIVMFPVLPDSPIVCNIRLGCYFFANANLIIFLLEILFCVLWVGCRGYIWSFSHLVKVILENDVLEKPP